MNEERFWIVWGPGLVQPPKVRHPSKEVAEKESQRLANEHRSLKFYVLEAQSVSQVEGMVTRDLHGPRVWSKY